MRPYAYGLKCLLLATAATISFGALPAAATTVTIDWGAGRFINNPENPHEVFAFNASPTTPVVSLGSSDDSEGFRTLSGEAAIGAHDGFGGAFQPGFSGYKQIEFEFVAQTDAPTYWVSLATGNGSEDFNLPTTGNAGYIDAYSVTGFKGFSFSSGGPFRDVNVTFGGGDFTVGTITLSNSDTPLLDTGFTSQSAPIAEPSSSLVLGIGLLGLTVWRRRASIVR